ncbi:MAG: hypothetical protein ACYCX3_07125 [Thermoleophilia bacterium]
MNDRTPASRAKRWIRGLVLVLALLGVSSSPALAVTYSAGLQTGGVPLPGGGTGPAASYGAMANIYTPSTAITRHPYTIKVVVGGIFSKPGFTHQHRTGWILRIGEARPRHYIEGYDPNGNFYEAFPLVGGNNSIGWGVGTADRVEYWTLGAYKCLIANTWWTSSYTTYPYNDGNPIPHFGAGLASNTGNDLRANVRSLKRQLAKYDPPSAYLEFRNWDTNITTDPSKYNINILTHGLGNSYWDNFDIFSAY